MTHTVSRIIWRGIALATAESCTACFIALRRSLPRCPDKWQLPAARGRHLREAKIHVLGVAPALIERRGLERAGFARHGAGRDENCRGRTSRSPIPVWPITVRTTGHRSVRNALRGLSAQPEASVHRLRPARRGVQHPAINRAALYQSLEAEEISHIFLCKVPLSD